MDKAVFLENLIRLRKERGLTQKQVAVALDISDKTYSKWETGENEPGIDALCRLADFYGTGADMFFAERYGDALPQGKPMGKAAGECFKKSSELLLDLRNAEYPRPENASALPTPPEAPEDMRMPETDRSIWRLCCGELMAIIAAGPDMNFNMLLMPHEEKYAWLIDKGDALESLFGLLAMPGAMRCIYGMLGEKSGSYYSADYLAKKTGASEAEAEAFLTEAERRGFAVPGTYLKSEGAVTMWEGNLTVQLVGLLTLARLLLYQDPRYGERRGDIVSGSVNVSFAEGETK
ncbi:MAG: helix-turn-helix transcriptional regulator [Oscillospiraceae bacterium]|nr:helix-turn-helix transcriptional regulator [Oscillospiraceae bacterium]